MIDWIEETEIMEESEMILRFQMCTTQRTLSYKETEEK